MIKSLNKAVISGVGPDQPGIVAALGKVLLERNCNVEDSTMTRLAGEFATIIIVSCPENVTIDRLEQDLIGLESELGMTFAIKPASEGSVEQSRNPYMISVTGADRTGIMFHVSKHLADCSINITDLNAHVMDAEQGAVYLMMVEADIPPTVSIDTLRADLGRLADELGVEIQLRPLEAVAL